MVRVLAHSAVGPGFNKDHLLRINLKAIAIRHRVNVGAHS